MGSVQKARWLSLNLLTLRHSIISYFRYDDVTVKKNVETVENDEIKVEAVEVSGAANDQNESNSTAVISADTHSTSSHQEALSPEKTSPAVKVKDIKEERAPSEPDVRTNNDREEEEEEEEDHSCTITSPTPRVEADEQGDDTDKEGTLEIEVVSSKEVEDQSREGTVEIEVEQDSEQKSEIRQEPDGGAPEQMAHPTVFDSKMCQSCFSMNCKKQQARLVTD